MRADWVAGWRGIRKLEHIHKEVIKFDSAWFESLIRMPVDHPYRRMDRVKMAREELGDLLELTQA